jgi:hypothetical protein
MFPFVISGTIVTSHRTDPEMDLLGQRLAEELRARGIVPEQRRGEITFLNKRNLFLQLLPFALFAPVDSGTFEIKANSITTVVLRPELRFVSAYAWSLACIGFGGEQRTADLAGIGLAAADRDVLRDSGPAAQTNAPASGLQFLKVL